MTEPAILAINPGTTTTRCALFQIGASTVSPIVEKTLEHDEAEMATFASIKAQLEFRAGHISEFLNEQLGNYRLVACAGRGGMLTPVPSGVIEVNDALVDFALHTPVYHHASNLGAPLANRIAQGYSVPAFVVDPVSVDELMPEARVSGVAELPRFSFVHALNIRACGRRLSSEIDKPFTSLKTVVAHLGAGFSIAALVNGRLVDSSNRMEISPFTPERAGGVPPLPLIELCYSGDYTREELLGRFYGQGGVFGYLGTKDIRKVEAMVDEGHEQARLVYKAMLYQISKAVGAMAAAANFDLDAIVLTGGLANSKRITGYLSDRLSRLAPVHVYPGSDECRALAEGAARVLNGTELPKTWPVDATQGVVNAHS